MYHLLFNPECVAQNLPSLVLSYNQIEHRRPLGILEQTSPFTAGLELDIIGPIRSRVIGAGDLPPVHVQQGVLFANQDFAHKMKSFFRDQIQLFELSADEDQASELRVVNPTRKFDCIDFTRSEVEVYEDEPRQCKWVGSLSVDPFRIEPGSQIFRIVGASDLIVVSSLGRDALLEAGLTTAFFDRKRITVNGRVRR